MNRLLNRLETSASRFNSLVDANLQAPIARALTLNLFEGEEQCAPESDTPKPPKPQRARPTIAVLSLAQRLLTSGG
jgi:hypothetical protein